MRAFLIIAACIAALLAQSPQAMAQTGFDRPGGDYTNFPVRSGDPAACAARCEREGRCRAWSFSYPLTAGTQRRLLAQKQRHARAWRIIAASPAFVVRRWRSRATRPPNSPSTGRAATTRRSPSRPTPTGRPARRPARPTTNAGPGPMPAPVTSRASRAAFSSMRSSRRGENLAASQALSDSAFVTFMHSRACTGLAASLASERIGRIWRQNKAGHDGVLQQSRGDDDEKETGIALAWAPR